MPTRSLPENPSLENLRKRAKQLRTDVRAGEAGSLAQVRESDEDVSPAGAFDDGAVVKPILPRSRLAEDRQPPPGEAANELGFVRYKRILSARAP